MLWSPNSLIFLLMSTISWSRTLTPSPLIHITIKYTELVLLKCSTEGAKVKFCMVELVEEYIAIIFLFSSKLITVLLYV